MNYAPPVFQQPALNGQFDPLFGAGADRYGKLPFGGGTKIPARQVHDKLNRRSNRRRGPAGMARVLFTNM